MKGQAARTFLRFSILAVFAASLAACGSSDKDGEKTSAAAGERIPVMASFASKPKIDPIAADFKIELPEAALNKSWTQSGGNVAHAPENPALAPAPKEIWASSAGSGSSRRFKLLASPLVAEGKVFTMDSIGRVSALDLKDGEKIWRTETTPEHRDGEAMGGGIAYDKGTVYATTGFGEVVALRAKDGNVLWRRVLGKPIRSAPTLSGGRLFAITIENETFALEAETGRVMWNHSGIAENAALMGASSAAVNGDTVVVAYSSGELFGLRTQNGRVVWGEVLAVPSRKGALPAIADIRGLPVIEKGRVFAVSHSGRAISIDERTGERVWEIDLGGINTPCVAGNALFLLTNENELVGVSRDRGQILWIKPLQKTKDPEKTYSAPIVFSGPVLAGGRLWLTNSMGELKGFNPENGDILYDEEIAEPFFLAPVVAEKTMLLLSDDGRIRAVQ